MALAMSKAAPLRPEIKLSQALKDYEAVLTEDQRQSLHDTSPLESNDVMALTFEINRRNAGRTSRTWGARLTTFLNSVKGFTAVVDVIIGNVGNPIASAVWGAVKMAMQAASAFENYFDALSTLLMNVGLSAPRYERYALLYPASASLRQELCNYFSVVIDLCKSSILFVRRPFISQALRIPRKPFEDEFGKLQKDLIKFGDAVKDEASLTAKQQQSLDSIEAARERKENSRFRRNGAMFQRETARQLEVNKRWRESKFKSRFLDLCSTYNHETALNQARRKGKSSWAFETDDYKEWKSSDSSSVLLCSGIVGAGKTVLCSSVVEELLVTKEADVSIGYFFCRGDDIESLKAREITGSLARQFLSCVPVDSFNKIERDFGGIALDIDQIVSHLGRILPPKIQYMVVLDGLDECESDELYRLFDTLQSLLRSPNHVFKLFWTGRSDFIAKVSHRLHSDFHVAISPSKNGPEISSFIELALDEALENGKLQIRDPQIIVKIQDALETGAREMFLWVVFQIESICRENTDDGILNTLEDLPKDLPTTYRRILRRLRDSGSTDPLVGKKIFEIVAAARRPLNLEELREAISIEPGNTTWNMSKLVNDVMRSLECCGSLIVIDEELSTVHFAHASIKQYLETSPNKLDIREYHMVPETADLGLGEILVTYLNLDVLQGQLTKFSKASEVLDSQYTSLFIKASASLPIIISTNLARKFLKNRKAPHFDIGRELEKVAGFTRDQKLQPLQINSLLSYAQDYWLSHTARFDHLYPIYQSSPFIVRGVFPNTRRTYFLWRKLIEGGIQTVVLPWTSDDAHNLSAKFLDLVAKSNNSALTDYTLTELHGRGEQGSRGVRQLLGLLPIQGSHSRKTRALINLDLYTHYRDSTFVHEYNHALRDAVENESVAMVQILLDWTPAEVNKWSFSGSLLHTALLRGNLSIVKKLLLSGAHVNARGSLGSPMETAAVSSIGEQAIPLLLAFGAEIIPVKESYSEEVKQALRLGLE